jgi:hypothetical protein
MGEPAKHLCALITFVWDISIRLGQPVLLMDPQEKVVVKKLYGSAQKKLKECRSAMLTENKEIYKDKLTFVSHWRSRSQQATDMEDIVVACP